MQGEANYVKKDVKYDVKKDVKYDVKECVRQRARWLTPSFTTRFTGVFTLLFTFHGVHTGSASMYCTIRRRIASSGSRPRAAPMLSAMLRG